MARQTNGTDQWLETASALDLTAYQLLTVQMWLWIDSFANANAIAMEFGNNEVNRAFYVQPDRSDGFFGVEAGGSGAAAERVWNRPSAAAWHHVMVMFDRSNAAASSQINHVYYDGVNQTVQGTAADGADTQTFTSKTLFLMARGGASNWTPGRVAEVAIWGGINLSGSDVSALYNGGSGALATSVQNSSLKFYWQLCGQVSPEPNTVGGVDLTVNGATSVAHPVSLCNVPTFTSAGPLNIFRIKKSWF